MDLRDKITDELLKRFPIEKEKQDPEHSAYYKNYEDNLFLSRIGDAARAAYENGPGGELKKMVSIGSSSAMTFNLLGDGAVDIPRDCKVGNKKCCGVIPAGTYAVEYEKQFFTLRTSRNSPANLDAFLHCEATGTAVFCEMKFLEWLGEQENSKLSMSYLDKDKWFEGSERAFSVFQKLINETRKTEGENIISRFDVYDAWQMLKHTLAIYNHTSAATGDAVNKFDIKSVAGQYKKIFLLNVVNELPEEWIAEAETRDGYMKRLHRERAQADEFISVMMNPGNGLPGLFEDDCKAQLCIAYISAKEFSGIFDISAERREYLKRYFD